jgi:hypothetical protein
MRAAYCSSMSIDACVTAGRQTPATMHRSTAALRIEVPPVVGSRCRQGVSAALNRALLTPRIRGLTLGSRPSPDTGPGNL